jgi:hypothetical protein
MWSLSEEHQSGSWLSGDKKQRRQVHLGGHRQCLKEMIPVGEIGEKDERARASPAIAGVLSDIHSDAGV